MTTKYVALGVLCLGVGACSLTTLTRTGPPHPPRESNCSFDLFTMVPPSGYVEIATVDVNPGAYGINAYKNLGEFKGQIASEVCKAGGDAAVAQADAFGTYARATVLRRRNPSTVASAPVASPPSGAPTSAAPAPSGVASASAMHPEAAPPPSPVHRGCEYDTQCKGDRICVRGECVSP